MCVGKLGEGNCKLSGQEEIWWLARQDRLLAWGYPQCKGRLREFMEAAEDMSWMKVVSFSTIGWSESSS